MALVVEDGTGTNPAANGYVSIAEWKSYWTTRGYDYSAYSDSLIATAIVRATDYIELWFRNRFLGYPMLVEQPLSWPRTGVEVNCVPQDGIVPVPLKKATHEYARRALVIELTPDPADRDKSGQVISQVSKKAGPVWVDTKYASVGAPTMQRYPAADKWLEDLICQGGGAIRA